MVPVQSTGYPVDLDSHSSDVIYALDMFRHVRDSRGFLNELHRLLKPSGTLFIESGHQPRDDAKQKIVKSNCCEFVKEEHNIFKCRPKNMKAHQADEPVAAPCHGRGCECGRPWHWVWLRKARARARRSILPTLPCRERMIGEVGRDEALS